MNRKIIKKKIILICIALFFIIIIFGTFFHKKMDQLFREQVYYRSIKLETKEITTKVMIGEEEGLSVQNIYVVYLPVTAVKHDTVMIVSQEEVPYGSYQVISERYITYNAIDENTVEIVDGIDNGEKVVIDYTDKLYDGMRVYAQNERSTPK